MRRVACLIMLMICVVAANAQHSVTDNTRQPRILLVVDASSSMLETWDTNDTRFKAAAKIVEALMDSIYSVNAGVEFGLRVYGHQTAAQYKDCYDSRQEVMFSKNNFTQMQLRLASIKPFGVSPIAYSLSEAAENDLGDAVHNAYSLILITDGGESCGGNICEVVKELIAKKIYFKPYILSLVDYPALKDQYSCLGTYLQVARPNDIGPAISQIMDAYRPQLSLPIMIVKSDPVLPQPKTVVVNVPAWIPEHHDAPSLPVTVNENDLPAVHSTETPHPIGMSQVGNVTREPKVPQELPATLNQKTTLNQVPVSSNIHDVRNSTLAQPDLGISREPKQQLPLPSGLALNPAKQIPAFHFAPSMLTPPFPIPSNYTDVIRGPKVAEALPNNLETNAHPVPAALYHPVTIRAPRIRIPNSAGDVSPEPKVADEIPTALNPSNAQHPAVTINNPRVNLTNTQVPTAEVKRDPVVVKAPIVLKPDTGKTTITMKPMEPMVSTVRQKPIPQPVLSEKPIETAYTAKSENSKETAVSIYFTDGHGKFYSTTPQLQMIDAGTGKLVKQFYRTVDASGIPDPVQVPAGTYSILLSGKKNMLLRGVTVPPNTNRIITITVSNGSLKFEYLGAPDKPVAEFDAIVNIRFEPGPTVKQRCTSILEYPPGNYYVEINTLPLTKLNTDITFGAVTTLTIAQPGILQFSNTTNVGDVAMFYQLGNKYVRFHGLRINGNPEDQRLRLQPGIYQIHWVKNPSLPFPKESIVEVTIRSGIIATVELH